VAWVIDTLPFACRGERLARVAGREPVDRLNLRPVDGGQVAEVRHTRETLGEDQGGVRVDLRLPHHIAAYDRLQSDR